jgi:hypothetical protein
VMTVVSSERSGVRGSIFNVVFRPR